MQAGITVVSITLNAAKTLPALLASLRAQTDRNFEFLVIDGASSDGTVSMLEQSGDVLTRIVSEPDSGFYDALNKAVRLITSSHYLVLGADDTLAPTAIADYKARAVESGADMVIGGVRAGSRILTGYHLQRRWRAPSAMLTSHSVGTLIRTSLHGRFGLYSTRYPIYADCLFMKRVCISDGTKVVDGKFIAGEFCIEGGISTSNTVRSLCELWMVQRETGENPFLQYILFQVRLLSHLRSVVSR